MSNQPRYTPGPWTPAGELATHILDSNRRMIADAPHPNGMSREEGYANRDLIAAAPDLLDVLKSSLNEHKEVREFLNVRISEGESVYVWLEETETMIGRIEAAIAKAEGRGE